jgi:hypothetical protein
VLQQSQDLDNHVHMITLLEAEKLDHVQSEYEVCLLRGKAAWEVMLVCLCQYLNNFSWNLVKLKLVPPYV